MDAVGVRPRGREDARSIPATHAVTWDRWANRRSVWIMVLALVGLVAIVLSLAVGNRPIPTTTVVDAVFDYDPTLADHLVVRELRVARTALGLLTGAALAVAGVLMQGITRNPLAEPGLLGVNAGAAFAIVAGSWLFGLTDVGRWVWLALLGAVASSVLVYVLGSVGRGHPSPVRLVLAGAAVSALMFSLTRAITLIDQATLEQYRFWVVGSLTGRDLTVAGDIFPFVTVGLIVAFAVAGPLNAIALGEESATSLGARVGRIRLATAAAVMLLAGAAVAAVGPVVFVGLVVPHLVRGMFGPDQRWLVPAAALAGGALLLISDVVGRLVVHPAELQVGIVMAAIGGPVFIFTVRRMRGASL